MNEPMDLGKDGAVAGNDDSGAPVYSCTLCKKHFRSVPTLQAHIRSTAHLIRKEKRIVERDSEAASMLTMTSLGSAAIGLHRRNNAKAKAFRAKEKQVEGPYVNPEEREEDASATRCMLCGYLSPDPEANEEHLENIHSFSIPLKHHCKDVPGLLDYLARKVNGLMCLVCNEKTRSYQTLGALRDHMRESGHQRVVLGVEYQDFYNCVLEDPDDMKKVEIEGDQLVVNAGKEKKLVLKKENEVPRNRPRETEEKAQERKAILAEEHAALVAAKQEQRELTYETRRKQAETLRSANGHQQAKNLKIGMISNKLHPRGFDGEGLKN